MLKYNMNRRTWVAGKPRKKPDLNIDAIPEDLLQSVSDLYAEKDADGKHCSLNTMVAELGKLGCLDILEQGFEDFF